MFQKAACQVTNPCNREPSLPQMDAAIPYAIKAPLLSIHSNWASKCPARKAGLKIPYEIILLGFQRPVNLLHVKTHLNKQDSIIQNHLSRCDKLHKKQEITSIKIHTQAAFSLLSAIRVMYNIQLLLPTEKHGYSSGAQISQNIKRHLWSLQTKSRCKTCLSYCTGTPISSLQLLKEQTKQVFDLNNSFKDYTLSPPLWLSTARYAPHQERETFPLLHVLHPDLSRCQNPAHVIVHPDTHCHPIVLAVNLNVTRNHAFLLENFQSCS